MAKKELMAAVKAYYDSQGWHYSYKPERDMIEMLIGLRDVSNCRVITKVRDDRFVTYCICPLRVREEKRAAVGEYLHRANYGLDIGNFEMDYDDGEIRYKANILCGDQIPKMEIIERLVDVGMDMFNHFGSGILEVTYGGKNPKEVIDEIEGEESADEPPELMSILEALERAGVQEGDEDLLGRLRGLKAKLSGESGEDEEEQEEEE